MNTAQNPLTPEAITCRPGSRDLDPPARALAIGAHPDDIDFGCGATLAKWAAAGCEVSVLVCTDGSKGTWDPSADEQALVNVREREQRDAVRALGGTGAVAFLGRVDGELANDLATRSEVASWIRRLRPDVVLGHDPWRRYRLHPDHRAAGFLVTDAIVAARDPKFFPDHGLAHHRPSTLLLFEADEPDHVEDVTGWDEAKYAALACHHSQFESTMGASNAAEMEQFRQRMLAKLAAAGAATGTVHAEVFKLIDDL